MTASHIVVSHIFDVQGDRNGLWSKEIGAWGLSVECRFVLQRSRTRKNGGVRGGRWRFMLYQRARGRTGTINERAGEQEQDDSFHHPVPARCILNVDVKSWRQCSCDSRGQHDVVNIIVKIV